MKRSVALAIGAGALTAALLGGLACLPEFSARAQVNAPPLDTSGDAAPRPWQRYKDWPQRDESKFNTLANGKLSPSAPRQPRKLWRQTIRH